MSAPSSLVAIGPAAKQSCDPVESRFNQLAKKILDELKQTNYSRDFFAALDQILLEPSQQKFRLAHVDGQRRPSRLRYKALARKQQELQVGLNQLVNITTSRRSSPGDLVSNSTSASGHYHSPAKQTQFTSLPVEVTSTTQARKQTTPKTKWAQTNQPQMNGNSKRSAIPVSKQPAYAINRSATVGDTYNLAARLPAKSTVQPGELKNNNNNNNKRPANTNQSRPNHTKLAASEKINQRRPTRAKLDQLDIEFLTDNSRGNSENDDDDDDVDFDDDDDDSEDSDDDSDEQQQQVAGGFASLAARRAYLSEKFIKQHKEQQQIEVKNKQQARPLQEISQVQRQKEKFSQKPATTTTGQATFGANQVVKSTSNVLISSHPASFASSQQPRSLGHPTTSPTQTKAATQTTTTMPTSQSIELSSKETLGHLYKPHMNYSTSLLGNHRLSDDDEIIIIPTASPSSLISSSCCSPANGLSSNHHNHNTSSNVACSEANHQPPDGDQEMSERFSISRTKSFWEKLSNTSAPNAKQASFEQNWTESGQENNNYQDNDYYHTSTA